MKVLHVLHELMPSGAEVMLQNSFDLWKSHGVNPEILSTGAKKGVYAAALAGVGYSIHHLPYGRNPLFFWGYMRFLRKGRFDVVHQHVEGSGFWFGLAGLLCGCRVIRVSHGNFRFEGRLRQRRGFQRRLLKRLGATFVAVGDGVRRNERERFGLEAELVWNWADVSRFAPPSALQRAEARARWGYADDDVVVVTVGNCAPVKNHCALIDAIAGDRRLHAVKYLHVGGEDSAASERAHACTHGVDKRVHFAGWLADPLPALHAADVYVMPSKFEGLGNATIEALSTGLPAVLADVAGLEDFRLIFPDLLYCEPTAEALAQRLTELCEMSAEQRGELSQSYPQLAQRAFSPERGVAEYVALYGLTGSAR